MQATSLTRRSALAAIAGFAAAGASWATAAPDVRGQRPSTDELLGDAALLQRAYEALHPGLYRYNTPVQMSGHFETLRRELADIPNGSPWLNETYLAFSRLAGKIRCGHTYANFYNQSKPVQQALFEPSACLPLEFRWVGTQMIVTRDLSVERHLTPGTEILAIDRVAAPALLKRLLPYARADGSNDAKRVALLEVQGLEGYETFDVFAGLLNPLADHVQLDIRRPQDGASRQVRVATLTHAQRAAMRHVRAEDTTSGWRFERESKALATLTMPSWALYNGKWDWKAFLAQTFQSLSDQPAGALVIDLRGNEGGLDVGNEILPYLTREEIAIPQPPRLVRYRDVPDELNRYLDTWDDSFRHWGDDAQRLDERYFELRSDDGHGADLQIAPREPTYTGQVFVLVGPDNSSATFQFAQIVRASRLGRLVGRTTGGNQRGINGGAFFFLRLPACGLELDVPLIARFTPGHPPDAGLRPDIVTPVSVADIVSGRDAELAAVRSTVSNAAVRAASV